MTITHPHHPLCGQRVLIVRLRRGSDPDLIVRLPDGSHTALAVSSTDYAGHGLPVCQTDLPPLLDLAGLRRMAELVAHLRTLQDAAGAPPAAPRGCAPAGTPLP